MPDIPQGFGQANYRLNLLGDPEPMMMTLGVEFSDVDTETYQEIANDLAQAFYDAWDSILSNPYTFSGVTLYASVDGGSLVVDSNNTFLPFVSASATLPQNSAYLLKKMTALGGRSGRGRMYMPGVLEGNVDNSGALLPGVQAVLQAAATTFLNDTNGVSGIGGAVLLHSGPPDIDPTPITALTVDGRIATQRRRLR